MAGNYPDVPGPRIPYDRDGTVGVIARIDNQTITRQLTAGEMVDLNDEDSDYLHVDQHNQNQAVVFLFPEPLDIVGYVLLTDWEDGGTPGPLETSPDSTTGLDGTWTTQVNPAQRLGFSKASLRNDVQSVNLTNVHAIRFLPQGGGHEDWTRFFNIHLFGNLTSPEVDNPQRLRLWHPTLDQEVDGAYFDWGDIQRSSTVTRDFRVKNQSPTQTAESINLSMESATDTSPSNVSQHSFSDDGGTNYAANLNIGDLAPGAISPVLTLRRVTDAAASLSLWTTRMVADAATWA